jgi:hypothetical protein
MSDKAQMIAVCILGGAILFSAIGYTYNQKTMCNAKSGVLVRGIWGFECMQQPR